MFDNILKDLKKIPIDKQINILEEFLIAKFGSEQQAKEEIMQIQQDGELTDKNIENIFNISSFNKLREIFRSIIGNEGLTGITKNINNIENIYKELTKGMSQDEINNLSSLMNIIETLGNKLIPKSDNDEYVFKQLRKKCSINISFSKEMIAKELGISKELLNKWLKDILNKKDNSRISFPNYLDIIRKFSLKKGEDETFIHSNLQQYIERIERGLVFSKKDFVDIDNSYYKIIKSDLEKKYKYYNQMDKFPYSAASELMEYLGNNIDNEI